MADLDMFFAKKDKKKVKGRKYDNPDEIAKRLKESEKKLEKELFKIEPVKKTLDEVLSTTSSNVGKDGVSPEPKQEKIKVRKSIMSPALFRSYNRATWPIYPLSHLKFLVASTRLRCFAIMRVA